MKYINIILLLFTFVVFSPVFPDGFNSFQSLDHLLVELKDHQGDVLYPQEYSQLQTKINDFRKNSATLSTDKFDREFKQLSTELNRWVLIAGNAQKHLVDVISIRERTLSIGGEDLPGNILNRAETQFRIAAEHFRKQKTSDAAQKARLLYQKAETEAIRNHLIGEISILLQECNELGAEKLTPESYKKTRQLFRQVQKLLAEKTPNHAELSAKSQRLLENAKTLLFLAQTLHPLYDSPANAESFLIKIKDQLAYLGKQLDTSLSFEEDLTSAFSTLFQAIQNLKRENSYLAQRNTELEQAKLELEHELISFKSIADQKQLLQLKINRVKTLLLQQVDEQNGVLKMHPDSIQFETSNDQLTERSKKHLHKFISVLREFSGSRITIQYMMYSNRNYLHDQNTASKRAEAIRKFLCERWKFAQENIQAVGLVFNSGEDYFPKSKLEISLDLESYLSVHDKNAFHVE